MSAQLDITIEIAPSLTDPVSLDLLQTKLRDLSPVLQLLETELVKDAVRWFDTDGDGTWAALSATTWRRKKSGQELVETGTLRQNLTNKILIDENSVVVGMYGDTINYAKWLNDGTKRMPARMLLNLTNQAVADILNLIVDWIVGSNTNLKDSVRIYDQLQLVADNPQIGVRINKTPIVGAQEQQQLGINPGASIVAPDSGISIWAPIGSPGGISQYILDTHFGDDVLGHISI